MLAIIYGYASTEWECEQCHSRNAGTAESCHGCNALYLPKATVATGAVPVATQTTTRTYREPRETGFNFMPITTLALVVGVIVVLCAFLYWLLE